LRRTISSSSASPLTISGGSSHWRGERSVRPSALCRLSAQKPAREFAEIDRLRIRQARQWIEAGQAQQLLEHARRPVGAGQHLRQRVPAIVGVGASARHLRLDFHHRQRRAQFVRRVGGKAAFVVERVTQPEQQPVERRQAAAALRAVPGGWQVA
jgi:hypothetical protein